MSAPTTSWVGRGVALAIVGLIVGVVIGYFVYPAVNPTTTAPTTGLPSVIKIGALLTLSGDLKSFGEDHQAALQLAQSEINNWLAVVRPGVQVQFVIEDTAAKPDTALSDLQALAAQGVKFVVGPLSSAELKNILSYANSNQIVVVSQSSTSMELAINKPFVFRFIPPDKYQGPAIAKVMWDAGIRYAIIVARHDSWGDGLSSYVSSRFQQLGGQFETVQYPPETQDFSAIVADLNNRVQAAIQKYGANHVGVNLISFEEGALLVHAAANYPALKQVRWFGSDGTAGSGAFLQDSTVVQFSMATKFVHTIFNPTHTSITDKVRNYVMSKLGREPDAYTYVVYDIAWVLAKAIVEVNAYDSVKVAQILPQVAASYFGASGWIYLDANHDRAIGDYGVWAIVNQGGSPTWVMVGVYSPVSDSVSYLPGYESFA